jgi:hypothetical protein
MVEDDLSLFYWTEGRISCPYAVKFEDKCEIKKFPADQQSKGPFKYKDVETDAILTVRNWDPKATYKIPPNKLLHFIYILEPPPIAQDAYLGYNNALLASYWKGSDVPIPYRIWKPLFSKNLSIAKITEEISLVMKSKTKLAVAMISNCGPYADARISLIKELQKYIHIDVYGKCGNFSCPTSQTRECLKSFENEYKFYLSFENSRCEDYITEKFFENALP